MKNCFFSHYENILEEIRETIKDKPQYTQAYLAKMLGVSRESLNRMLNNKSSMKAEYMVFLTQELGIKSLL